MSDDLWHSGYMLLIERRARARGLILCATHAKRTQFALCAHEHASQKLFGSAVVTSLQSTVCVREAPP